MEVYKYRILKDSGEIVRGEIQGYSKNDVISRLLMDNCTILEVKRKMFNFLYKPIFRSYTSKIEGLLLITNQLKVMTSSGLSIIESVKFIEENIDDRNMKKTLKSIYSNLHYGNSLKNSLDPKVFPIFFIHVIGIGEASGNLEEALKSLSDYYSKDLEFYHKLKNMLYYPAILLGLSFITLYFTTNFIVPNFMGFLEDGINSLPWYSRMVFNFSSLLQELWHILFLTLIILSFILHRNFQRFSNTKIFSLMMFKTPIISKLLIKRILLKFVKNLQVIIKSGSNLSYAISFLSKNHSNLFFRESLNNILLRIAKGNKFSEALKTEKRFFTPVIINMISAGERSGDLTFVLEKITEYLQDDLDQKTKKFISLLEPSLIVIMAIVVGGILISVMVPIFSSYEFMI